MQKTLVGANYEVQEFELCYFFRFDLPGLTGDELKVEIIDNELVVSNRKPRPDNADGFSTCFVFPRRIVAEQAHARFSQGVLRVLVPKREYTRSREVPLEAERIGLFDRHSEPREWRHYLEGDRTEEINIGLGCKPVEMTA